MNTSKLTSFEIDSRGLPVRYVETMQVKEGVICDVYQFSQDDTKDLAIVTVSPGAKTPLQRVLLGASTIEGFMSGEGILTIWSADGVRQVHEFTPNSRGASVTVEIGQFMQWHASGKSDLVFFEICEPPYADGRFENLPDDAVPGIGPS